MKGTLICYCYATDQIIDIKDKDLFTKLKSFIDDDGENSKNVKHGCSMINNYRSWTLFLSIKISLSIVTMNIILEEVIVYFVDNLGIDTYSQAVTITKYIIFIMYMFNSNICILLMAAKFEKISWLSMFKGKYTDFSNEWFIVIGSQFMLNQLVDLFMPLVGYLVAWLLQRLFMSID